MGFPQDPGKERRDLMAKCINSLIMTLYDKGTKPEDVEIDKVISLSETVIKALYPPIKVSKNQTTYNESTQGDSLDLTL